MSLLKEKNTLKNVLRYVFFVSLILWALTTVYVIYQYLWSSSKQVVTKWWTLVEWIFNTTSFLPYLNNDWESRFFQSFLFDRCLTYSINDEWNLEYQDKLCHVTTKDYKSYYITINSGMTWSDGVPMSIDDVYFTYNEIIKNNKFGLSYLEKYSTIDVKMEGETVQVTFKNSSQDNTLFFTNYLLPKHALIDPTLDLYQQSFAIEPIYNNCAKIKSQSTDQYSLIFDLANCTNTNLWFYQIKNAISFDKFKESSSQINWSIIDMYLWDETLNGYTSINLKSNDLATLFFNTKSNKMTVRLRRALGGFIHENFFEWTWENEYLDKYKWDILNQFLSTGAEIQTFLSRVSVDESLNKQELIEWWVKPFTWNVNFTEKNKVFAYYTEDSSQKFNMKFTFDVAYKKIAIAYGDKELYYPSSYSQSSKSASYVISAANNNLWPNLNTYIIYWFTWDSKTWKIQIWTLNLYNLYQKEKSESNFIEQLKIVYFDNTVSNYIIWRLKQIFSEANIWDYFVYEKVSDVNELEWKLVAGEYDIVLNTIERWLNKDISSLFATEAVTINPSQYTDPRLLSLLKQYNEADNKSKLITEINWIYSNDMPIVILWSPYEKLNIKDNILDKLDKDNLNLYVYNWRDVIYKTISLTENIYIDKDKVKDLRNFWRFIKDPENY